MTFIWVLRCTFTFREQKLKPGALSLLPPLSLRLWWRIGDYYYFYYLKQMNFLSSPHRASRNVSCVFPAAPSCFDTSARELCGEGRRGRIQRLTLDLGSPAGCRLPRGCHHHFGSPSAALKATIDQCTECFTAAALDGPPEKLIAVNSQQIEAHRLVSWSHQWAPWLSCFNYSSRPSGY